jgi:hypothetical protein
MASAQTVVGPRKLPTIHRRGDVARPKGEHWKLTRDVKGRFRTTATENPAGGMALLLGALTTALFAGVGAGIGAAVKAPALLGTKADCAGADKDSPQCSAGTGAKLGAAIGTMFAAGVGLTVAAVSEEYRHVGFATAGIAGLALPVEQLVFPRI